MTAEEILQKIKTAYKEILGEKLTGIYVHGSLAFHCFVWDKSDIDFIVVVKNAPDQQEKEALIRVLLELDAYVPPKGLEMSVVLESVCNPFVYPTPFELHFSNAHKQRCQTDPAEYCRNMNGTDRDLAAHFTVLRAVGEVLWGREISQVFGEVPRDCYIDSIRMDIEDARECILENPIYYVLNLTRVLACLTEGLVLSKKQGGQWGLKNLSGQYHPLITEALTCYGSSQEMDEDEKTLREFAEYMLKQIPEESKT